MIIKPEPSKNKYKMFFSLDSEAEDYSFNYTCSEILKRRNEKRRNLVCS